MDFPLLPRLRLPLPPTDPKQFRGSLPVRYLFDIDGKLRSAARKKQILTNPTYPPYPTAAIRQPGDLVHSLLECSKRHRQAEQYPCASLKIRAPSGEYLPGPEQMISLSTWYSSLSPLVLRITYFHLRYSQSLAHFRRISTRKLISYPSPLPMEKTISPRRRMIDYAPFSANDR